MAAWALAQSPLLYKQSVIVSLQGKSGGLAAYDQATGKRLWQAMDVPGTAYCSPSLVTIDGVDQIILTYGTGVAAVDPANGKLLWKFAGWKGSIPIPNVTAMGDGRLFVTGGYKAGSVMIQVSRQDATFAAKELWRIPQGAQIHQPVPCTLR